MARKPDISSQEEQDNTLTTMQAQQRILELKRGRDQRMAEAAAKACTKIDDIIARAKEREAQIEHKEKLRKEKVLADIVHLTQKRYALEAAMTAIVMEMHMSISEVEDMMKAGYDGRQRDVKNACDKRRAE